MNKKIKIAYISIPAFSDVDISLLSELQKKADVYYIIPLIRGYLNSTAINIKQQYPKSGFFKANIYSELKEFEDIIDISKMYVLNCCGKAYSIKNVFLNVRLFLFLFKNNFDIIHFTSFPLYFEFWKYFFPKKTVLTVHDPFPHPHDMNLFNKIYRKLSFSIFNHFIILNKAQKNDFVKYYGLQNKNIYDSKLSIYTYIHKYGLKRAIKDEKYILFFGRITSYKGLSLLFPAMSRIHQVYPNIKLLIAGKGNFDFDISPYKKVNYIEIINRFIPDSELSQLINNSLFVVCPYTSATQSGVIMTSFAFKKPVIATNVGGLKEMVIHEKYGLIIPPNDEDSLVSAIKYLLLNPKVLSEMEKNIGLDYFAGEKSWKYISDGYISIYNSIIKRGE